MICSLIVFVKNPIAGKVKTRLAAKAGHQKAVEVYCELLQHTKNITIEWLHQNSLDYDKRVVVYYGDFINNNDLWTSDFFSKKSQPDVPDLGGRMRAAFEAEFTEADRVVVIGSDCLDIKSKHLKEAFEHLAKAEVVIGPANDGGYYLLGMSQLHPYLFENKPWSQAHLLEETLADLKKYKSNRATRLPYYLLETLSDIDTWEDYIEAKNISKP